MTRRKVGSEQRTSSLATLTSSVIRLMCPAQETACSNHGRGKEEPCPASLVQAQLCPLRPRSSQPEKRKVGGSTPPLTTSQLAVCGPVTRLKVSHRWICSGSPCDRDCPFTTVVCYPLGHAECTTHDPLGAIGDP
jgi:hypothetical protein